MKLHYRPAKAQYLERLDMGPISYRNLKCQCFTHIKRASHFTAPGVNACLKQFPTSLSVSKCLRGLKKVFMQNKTPAKQWDIFR